MPCTRFPRLRPWATDVLHAGATLARHGAVSVSGTMEQAYACGSVPHRLGVCGEELVIGFVHGGKVVHGGQETFILTTLARLLPASSRMADRFFSDCRCTKESKKEGVGVVSHRIVTGREGAGRRSVNSRPCP